jgi:hypothetical protein
MGKKIKIDDDDIDEAVSRWRQNYLTGGSYAADRRDIAMFDCLNIMMRDLRIIAKSLEKMVEIELVRNS